ncbi:DNA/RNA non-specific endonuclease [Ekhidna sp. To15]|uniref:DNA/RNA non-specific endonuclease n=1 Tax=Ekhidna sp. To15 TaxID=3395267 RepID=UPI003F51CA17
MKLVFAVFSIAIASFSYGQKHLAPLFTYGGLPEVDDVQILYNKGFIVGYSNEKKSPLWTCYRLGNVKKTYERVDTTLVKWERPRSFQLDNRTTARVSHDDYTRSGYDRGHMAPDAAIQAQYGQSALLETYLMSNIAPQHRDLNRGIWQRLESYARKTLSQDDTYRKEINDVFVITGPIYQDDLGMIGDGVVVPSHCYKIFAYSRGYGATIKAVAFVFPQHPDTDDFFDYVTTVDDIEELTGIDFHPSLSTIKQRNLESKKRNFDLTDR